MYLRREVRALGGYAYYMKDLGSGRDGAGVTAGSRYMLVLGSGRECAGVTAGRVGQRLGRRKWGVLGTASAA